MRQARVSLLGVLSLAFSSRAAAQVIGTCGGEPPSPVADCQNNDCGSCGGACCRVSFEVAEGTLRAASLLNCSFQGGPDGLYTPQAMAEGTTGFADLRPFKKAVDFIGQVHHMTSGPKHYNDSVAFTVAPRAGGGSIIQAFSMSLVGGAYCDNGQNYKNIVLLMKTISWARGYNASKTGPSCPAPEGAAAPALHV